MICEPDGFVSTQEAAELIHCTPGRVRQLLDEGILKGKKLNARAWAVYLESVKTYAKTERHPGPKKRAG